MTTVWAWEKTVVMVKQPGHLTSMKKDRGAGTRVWIIVLAKAYNTGQGQGGSSSSSSTNLELVLLRLSSRAGVEQIYGQDLEERHRSASEPHPSFPCPSQHILPGAAGGARGAPARRGRPGPPGGGAGRAAARVS